MAHRLKTAEGRKLYALRKHTPEPVFGIIKSVLGFRQFLLRGLENLRGEWSLVTMSRDRRYSCPNRPQPALVPRLHRQNPVDQPSRPHKPIEGHQ